MPRCHGWFLQTIRPDLPSPLLFTSTTRCTRLGRGRNKMARKEWLVWGRVVTGYLLRPSSHYIHPMTARNIFLHVIYHYTSHGDEGCRCAPSARHHPSFPSSHGSLSWHPFTYTRRYRCEKRSSILTLKIIYHFPLGSTHQRSSRISLLGHGKVPRCERVSMGGYLRLFPLSGHGKITQIYSPRFLLTHLTILTANESKESDIHRKFIRYQ